MSKLCIEPVYVERNRDTITGIVDDDINCQSDDDHWVFYSRDGYLAFRLNIPNEDTCLVAKVGDVETALEASRFENQTYWFEKWDKERPTSYSAAGQVHILARKDGVDIASTPPIRIRPNCVTENEYNEMVRELIIYDKKLAKFEYILEDEPARATVGLLLKNELPDLDILALVKELINEMQAIRNQPAVVLRKLPINMPARKIRKHDSHVMKGLVQRGGSGKIRTVAAQESLDVYENRIIKAYLIWLHDELDDRCKDYRPDGDEVLSDSAKAMREIYEEAKNVIAQELRHPWYNSIAGCSYEWPKPTQLFSRNPHYSRVYQIMTDIEEEDELERARRSGAFFGVTKTCEVYEYWMLFKIVWQLLKLDFKPDGVDGLRGLRYSMRCDLFEGLRNHVRNHLNESKPRAATKVHETFGGYSLQLEKALGRGYRWNYEARRFDSVPEQKLRVRVGFNVEIKPERTDLRWHRGKLRPDYHFQVELLEGDEVIDSYQMIADAKYKDYVKGSLEDEIRGECLWKYLHHLDEGNLVGVFILHPDHKINAQSPWLFGAGHEMVRWPEGRSLDDPEIRHEAKEEIGHIRKWKKERDRIRQWERVVAAIEEGEIGGNGPLRYGALSLTPSHSSGVKTLLKILFRHEYWHTGIERGVCWSCGKIEGDKDENGDNIVESHDYGCNMWFRCKECDSAIDYSDRDMRFLNL